MKRMHSSIVYLCLWFSLFLGTSAFALTPKDIANHQYRESIQYLYDHGVVEGYTDGTFGPDREITRAEIMKIITKADVWDAVGSWSNCFSDVTTDRYAIYVCYAKEHNIVKGYTDGTFKPAQNIIIAEAFKMWLETFNANVGGVKSGDKRYQPYMDFVHNNTIFSKYAVSPTKNITRGEMAFLIHKLMLNKAWSLSFTNVRDVKSPGCGKTTPSSPITSSLVNGQTRNYITEIGDEYNENTPIKLILAFHGRTNSNAEVREYYDINEAAAGNAIIVYPSGLPEETSPRNWSNGWDKSYELRDFALFDKIVKDFTENYCIDMDQIFVVGHSLGAWFTNSLSCARGSVIRAIGSVGGGTTINTCNGPIAAITMQNPDDNLSPYSVAVTARDQMLRQNWCWTKTVPYGSVGNCVLYTDCQKDAPVVWCPYTESYTSNGRYYPHLWPDYAGELILDFFEGLQ